MIANRIKPILNDIISPSQTGFLKGRFIGENSRLVYDIIDWLNNNRKTALMLLADFEKAFDTINWQYMHEVLEKYGFSVGLRKWIQVLYRDAKSCVINNGHFSTFFQLQRGCRQGDPLSPYLFILAIEPLGQDIKNDKNIKGVTIGSTEHILGQYADDTFFVLDGSPKTLKNLLTTLKLFEKASGLRLNVSKTEAVWVGHKPKEKKPICPELQLKWVDNFKLLGITYKSDLKDITEINYTHSKLSEMKKILICYKKRHLSLIGKISVIKTLVLPKLVHLISVLPSPSKTFISDINSMFNKFVWNDGRPRINRKLLSKDYRDGGLKFTCIETFNTALKAAWVKRLYVSTGGWQDLYGNIVMQAKNGSIWELDVKSLSQIAKEVKNVFWKEVIESWVKYVNASGAEAEIDIVLCPIWNTYFVNNCNLKTLAKKLNKAGCNKFKDIVNVQTKSFYTHQEFVQKYKVRITFLDFANLLYSIPEEWKRVLLQYDFNVNKLYECKSCVFKVLKAKRTSHTIYWTLVNKVEVLTVGLNKWKDICKHDIKEEEWPKYHLSIHNTCMEVKMKSFQYQIVHRSLPTNKYLAMCNLIESEKCYFCEKEIETIEHLFCHCKIIQPLWQGLVAWLRPELMVTKLEDKNIIFGYIGTDASFRCINMLILITKRYIYVRKCQKMHVSFVDLKCYILMYYHVEKYIASKNENVQKWFKQKWSFIERKMELMAS